MIKHTKMREIEQFRHIMYHINRQENKPRLINAIGTVKLHGTNVSVCRNNDDIWTQSKNQIITPEQDHVDFSKFAFSKLDFFKEKFNKIQDYCGLTKKDTIAIYGEWVGQGIQKTVAISKIEKSFFIIGIKIVPEDRNIDSYWIDLPSPKESNIYDINSFKNFHLEIDTKNIDLTHDRIKKMVLEVEQECPVAKGLGFSGIGEGIVFKFNLAGREYVFKAKGDKHTRNAKKKKIVSGNKSEIDRIANIVTPEWRLQQMYDETFDVMNGRVGNIKKIGSFIKAVHMDVQKEDMDLIIQAELTFKCISKAVSTIARNWFMDNYV